MNTGQRGSDSKLMSSMWLRPNGQPRQEALTLDQRLFQGGEGQVIFSQGGMEMIQEIRTCGGGDSALGQFALNLPRLAYLPGERQRLTQCG